MNPEQETATMNPECEGSTTATVSLLPPQCPRFETCNAALCPIDPVWRTTAHLPGEKVCYYLLVSGKQGAGARFPDDPVFRTCCERLPEVRAAHPPVAKEIDRAARSGFRGGHLLKRQPDAISAGTTLGDDGTDG